MSALDFIMNTTAVEATEDLGAYQGAWLLEYAKNEALTEEVTYLRGEIQEIQEDLLRISDAFDNVGWAPLEGEQAKELPLATVKKIASVARAMNAVNPFVKRGVNARISYVWGRGVKFDGIDGVKDQFAKNRSKMFSPQAYEELERVLATDGNAFLALPIKDEVKGMPTSSFRVILDEITNAVSNPMDKEEIWYYQRTYKIVVTDRETGEQETQEEIKWYASLGYYQKLQSIGKNLPKRWNKHGVEQNYVMQHTAVNKQVGWRWGVPDILPVIYWAKAYKEYLEDNAMLVKAYSRLAWQVKVPNASAGNVASAQVMAPPTRDPLTGEVKNIGGTFVGTHEVTPINASGSNVDFSNGSALASAIAAGLEVSKVVILSDSGASNRAAEEGLDLPTLKAMESRQQIHVERFMEIFEFWGAKVDLNMSSQLLTIEEQARRNIEIVESAGEKPEPSEYASVVFPPIESSSEKDHITAVGTAVELGVLFPAEARREVLEAMNISPIKPWWELPTLEDNPAKKEEQEAAAEQAERQFQLDQQSVIAKQGVSGGVSAKGGSQTTSNQARDNRAADSKKK
jgi:hypothetical protein